MGDFSHFLSDDNSPKNSPSRNPQKQSDTNSMSPSKYQNNISNNSESNFISQSRSNHVVLKEKNSKTSADDLIFAGLQRYNSMTVPYNDKNKKTDTNKNNNID